MLNEEKIKLMTRISIFEKHEKSRDLRTSKYFKEDYVRYGGLRTIIAATVCYWLIVMIYCYFNMQAILSKINDMDYFKVIGLLMSGYLLVVLILYVVGFFVYFGKYQAARKKLIVYNRDLKTLINLGVKKKKKVINAEKIKATPIGGEIEGIDSAFVDNGKEQ